MKNVILVGKMSDVMRSIYDSLVSEFSVQLCAADKESIQGIMKIIKPDLVILGCFGSEDIHSEIFEMFYKKYTSMPVLVIANKDDRSKYEDYCTKKQFELLLRPTTNVKLMECCLRMLETERRKDKKVEETVKKKLLVVDDSPLVLRNIKSLLEGDYTVFLATSGEQALAFIPKKKPDLILLDYEMPGMDGKETFEAIREDDFSKDIPVIFLTSVSEKSQIYDVLKYYPSGYILKPPSQEELLNRIGEVLNKTEE